MWKSKTNFLFWHILLGNIGPSLIYLLAKKILINFLIDMKKVISCRFWSNLSPFETLTWEQDRLQTCSFHRKLGNIMLLHCMQKIGFCQFFTLKMCDFIKICNLSYFAQNRHSWFTCCLRIIKGSVKCCHMKNVIPA